MENNQSNKPEKLVPKDSGKKKAGDPENGEGTVLKKEDKVYRAEEADFGDVAKKRERSDRERS